MGKQLRLEEHLAYLKKTNLNTIVLEGSSDIVFYREMLCDKVTEENLYCVDNCDNLEALFKKRHSYKNKNIIFVRDKDRYVFDNDLPEDLIGIVFTDGYSIENDILSNSDWIEKNVGKSHLAYYNSSVDTFINYYAQEYEKNQDGKPSKFDMHPDCVMDDNNNLVQERINSYHIPREETISFIRNDYKRLIRGHSLVQLIYRAMNHREKNQKVDEPKCEHNYYCLQCLRNEPKSAMTIKKRLFEEISKWT